MNTTPDEVFSAVFSRLLAGLTHLGVQVVRGADLPQTIPTPGLVNVIWGDPGEPDTTLNPYSEYFQHRFGVEIFMKAPAPASDTKEEAIATIYEQIKVLLEGDPGLGGKACSAWADVLTLETLDIEGAPEILVGTFDLVAEYELMDLLA